MRGVQRDVGVAVLGRPDDRLGAQDARNPDARVGLLERRRPGVDHAVLIVGALPAERPRLGPGLDDQVVRLFEALAVEGRVDAGGELLLAAAADEAGDQRPFEIMSIMASSSARRTGFSASGSGLPSMTMLTAWSPREDRGEDVGLGLHAERRVVVLVQHDPVEADLLGKRYSSMYSL